MTLSQHDLIVRFGDAATQGSASVFLGAGASVDSGYPSWTELMRFARSELGVDETDVSDLARIAQYYAQTVAGGREALEAGVARQLLAVRGAPNRLHRALAKLPVFEYWTTNYDSMIEESLSEARVIAAESELTGVFDSRTERVFKMHGSLKEWFPGDVPRYILTRDDFDLYPTTHHKFWSLLAAQYLTRTFLFIGLSFEDPNIEHLLKLSRHSPTTPNEHFTIMKRPGSGLSAFRLKVADLERSGVRVCLVDDYQEIANTIEVLDLRCRPLRLFVSGSLDSEEHLGLIQVVGGLLADSPISMSVGGPAGRWLGFSFASALEARASYDPGRLRIFYQKTEIQPPPERQLGTAVFFGSTRPEMRNEILNEVRAVLVVSGGAGTADEVRRARKIGLPVIPLGSTGGTAELVWREMADNLGSYEFGGEAIAESAFRLLKHQDSIVCAKQAVEFIRKAMFT